MAAECMNCAIKLQMPHSSESTLGLITQLFGNYIHVTPQYIQWTIQSYTIWDSTWENLSSEVCEQHKSRPDCASVQSDQRLCYSLIVKYYIKMCYLRNFKFLASLCSWGDWVESHCSDSGKTGFVAPRPIWSNLQHKVQLGMCIQRRL